MGNKWRKLECFWDQLESIICWICPRNNNLFIWLMIICIKYMDNFSFFLVNYNSTHVFLIHLSIIPFRGIKSFSLLECEVHVNFYRHNPTHAKWWEARVWEGWDTLSLCKRTTSMRKLCIRLQTFISYLVFASIKYYVRILILSFMSLLGTWEYVVKTTHIKSIRCCYAINHL